MTGGLSPADLAADHELSDIAESFRFLLDLTPMDALDARERFRVDGAPPRFSYRALEDDTEVIAKRLDAVDLDGVDDPTLASMLHAKRRELDLQLQMLEHRGADGFLALSIELFGGVTPALRAEADAILATVPPPVPSDGPWVEADAFVLAAQRELDRYRAFVPDLRSQVELRDGSGGVMVSNGDVLVDPTLRLSRARLAALLHHEVGVHVVTHANGRHQPLHVMATGLAGHDETQEGLAVLAEHLVGGLSAARLRQLAARVVAVAEMAGGVSFPEVHALLTELGMRWESAFTVTMRVFRAGGLTKDAVYLRGLRQLVEHVGAGGDLEVLWLGKLSLEAAPLVQRLVDQGALQPPILRPRFLDDPAASSRLGALTQGQPLTDLIGDVLVKLGFVVNSVATEAPEYTTIRLARAAVRHGHETWLMGVDDFAHRLDGAVAARAARAPKTAQRSLPAFLGAIQSAERTEIEVDDLDVLVMRNDPADDLVERPWAVTSGVLFGQLSVTRGTLVVNDPFSLADAVNKTYFQHFPEIVRPRTLISRDPADISEFIDAMDGQAVLKPLQGSGGSGVFYVSSDESPNLNQMIEALGRDGYIVAQEALPEAEQGDVRLFVMNGKPLVAGGHHAAFRRVNRTRDRRSNMRVGGESGRVKVTDPMLELAEAVRPKLIADGMFLVGLDIVGDKLMEVNVFSPGGLGSCERLYRARFTDAVIDALERKVDLRSHYPAGLDNRRWATH